MSPTLPKPFSGSLTPGSLPGSTPGTLPGSTLDTGANLNTGLDTSGTLPGTMTSDTSASSGFNEPTPSPALDREPGVDRRTALRFGAAGVAALLVGCGKNKKAQRAQGTGKPGKEESDLKQHVQLPPDGLVDPAIGYETYASPDLPAQATPPKKGMTRKGAIILGAGAATVVGAIAWGATVFLVRRANRLDTSKITKLNPELMMANEYCDLGEKGIIIRYAEADGSLATTTLKNIGDVTYIRALEKHRPIFPANPFKWSAWRRGDLKKCFFKPEEMLKAQGITEEQLQERKDAAEFIKKAIAQGWIRKVELKDKKGATIDMVYEFLLTHYTPKKKAAKATAEKTPEEKPAKAPADGANSNTGSSEIKTHAFVKLSNGGYDLHTKDQQKVAYSAPWQGAVIEKLMESKNGMAVGLLKGQIQENGVTETDITGLLQDLVTVGVLVAGETALPSNHSILPGVEYRITAPAVLKDRAEAKLGNDKGVRVFSVTAASETRSDTGGHQDAPQQSEEEENKLGTEDPTRAGVEPSTLATGSEMDALDEGVETMPRPPARPAAAPEIPEAPAPVAAPPLPTPPSDGPSRDAGRRTVDRALKPEEADETLALDKGLAGAATPDAVGKSIEVNLVDDDEAIGAKKPNEIELSASDLVPATGLLEPLIHLKGTEDEHVFEDEEAAVLRFAMDGPIAGDIGEALSAADSNIDSLKASKAALELIGTPEEPGWLVQTDQGIRVRPDLVSQFVMEEPELDAVDADPDDVIGSEDISDESVGAAKTGDSAPTSATGFESASHTIVTSASAQHTLDVKKDLAAQAEETLANRKAALDEAKELVAAARSDLTEARETRDIMEDAALGAPNDATQAEFTDAQQAVDNKKAILKNAQKEARQLSGSVKDAAKELEAAKAEVAKAEKALEDAIKYEEAAAKLKEEQSAEKALDAAATQEMDGDEINARLAETPEVKIAREHHEAQQQAVADAQAKVDEAQNEVDAKTAAVRSATKETRKQARAELSAANEAHGLALDVLDAHEEDEATARTAYENALREAEEAERAAAEEAKAAEAAAAAGETADVQRTRADLEAATEAVQAAQADVDSAQAEADEKAQAVRSATKDNRTQARAEAATANAALENAFDALDDAENAEEAARTAYVNAQRDAKEAAREAEEAAKKEAEEAKAAEQAADVDDAAKTQQFKRGEVNDAPKAAELKRGEVDDAVRAAQQKKVAIEGAFDDLNNNGTVTVPAVMGRGVLKLLGAEGFVKDEDFTARTANKQTTFTLLD